MPSASSDSSSNLRKERKYWSLGTDPEVRMLLLEFVNGEKVRIRADLRAPPNLEAE